eukprot:scaffold8303_cov129-Ochromonas_danica.AAC.1
MPNRLYSGLQQGPRARSEWVKDLEDKNLLLQDNDFFKTFLLVVESSPDLLRLLNGEKIANFDFTVVRVGDEEPKKKNIVGS